MNGAWKYANRYGYPDDDIQGAIAEHHGVKRENILMGAGSGEILEVVGVEPSYGSVYQHASGIKAESVLLPLLGDSRQNIPLMIQTTQRNYRDVGFVYLCNPNNPTGITVTADEVRRVLNGIPEDVPVLIDEAYHHFVEDSAYATAVPYVLEGRKVIVARTFSKIYGMAAMRLGYAVAPPEMIREMSAYSTGTINALVKWGGAQALRDTGAQAEVRNKTIAAREPGGDRRCAHRLWRLRVRVCAAPAIPSPATSGGRHRARALVSERAAGSGAPPSPLFARQRRRRRAARPR